MALALVQRPNALLQRQQRFVYLCPIDSRLLVHVHMISASLIPRQVDERNLAEQLLPVFQRNLKNRMRAGGVGVGGILRGHAFLAPQREVLAEFLSRRNICFFEPDDIDVVFVVLTQFELIALVEQVIEPSAVDLIKREFGLEVAELRLSDG